MHAGETRNPRFGAKKSGRPMPHLSQYRAFAAHGRGWYVALEMMDGTVMRMRPKNNVLYPVTFRRVLSKGTTKKVHVYG
jgi:hypothetical protein